MDVRRDPRYDSKFHHLPAWSDEVAIKGAREILMGLKYPDDQTRRSLYASWLKVFASNQWHDSFDGLMLECVAATPSPTKPEQPLFANIFRVQHPADGPIPDVQEPVLKLSHLPDLFVHNQEPIEPLPTSPGLIDYLVQLIRSSDTNRAALDEAGLIIGFCCLVLAVGSVESQSFVPSFFQRRLKQALATTVPTAFNGDIFVPTENFVREMAFKSHMDNGVIMPFLVCLVLGQYAYHMSAEVSLSADISFLREGFMNWTRYCRLEVIDLLHVLEEQSGLHATEINSLIQSRNTPRLVMESAADVAKYLEGAGGPMQTTRPWCRAVSASFFMDLDLGSHLQYAVRLTALLESDLEHRLWARAEFSVVPRAHVQEALIWAREFKRFLQERNNADPEESPLLQTEG